MPAIQEVQVPNFPVGDSPYSRGIKAGNQVYVSGQLAFDLTTNEFINGDIADQTRLCILNVKRVLEAAGSSLDKTVKVTVFLADINDWPAMNVEYAKHFLKPAPARSAFQVAALPFGAKVEIEAIAVIE
ncbi:RutC family protein [Smittium mucronatum]|uniref:RutC family protein n=1 Tax=Smittium mucronatum TaxID=133383 RepID=A0A1R0H1R2_9FUNG|nr:RutC family protein [Smittium mucronatum]